MSSCGRVYSSFRSRDQTCALSHTHPPCICTSHWNSLQPVTIFTCTDRPTYTTKVTTLTPYTIMFYSCKSRSRNLRVLLSWETSLRFLQHVHQSSEVPKLCPQNRKFPVSFAHTTSNLRPNLMHYQIITKVSIY